MTATLRQALAIAAKDLRAEWRTKESLNAALAFTVVVLLLFSFAFDPGAESTREFAGGLLWLVFAFAAVVILNRAFARELPNDALDALVCSPVSPAALFLGKAWASMALMALLEAVALPVFSIFYSVRWLHRGWPMAGVLALGTWALVVVGVSLSALTVNLRLREVMLPTLLYPLSVPALLAAIELTRLLLADQPIQGDSLLWVRVLVVFDTIYTLLALFLVEFILVE